MRGSRSWDERYVVFGDERLPRNGQVTCSTDEISCEYKQEAELRFLYVSVGELFGADKETFGGLAGVGDTFGTCMGPLSRNR